MSSVDDIAVIGACPQPVLRNLRITVLLDRMPFIADLFRTRHEDATLFDRPFNADQLRTIADGRMPDGAL